MSLGARADGWWLTPAPAQRLAAVRILVGLFAFVYVTLRLDHFGDFAWHEAGSFRPIGVVALAVARPLGGVATWSLAVATALAGLAFVLGWHHRILAPLFASLLLWVTSYASSWGMPFHTENLLVLHVIVLAVAPAADAFALGARDRDHGATHARYGWPLRLMGAVTAATYFVAGAAKLTLGGIGWAGGEPLRAHVAYDLVRKAELGSFYSPLGGWLSDRGWPWPLFALLALAVELGAPLALVGKRAAIAWCVAALVFHLGVLAVMAILFPYPISAIAFAPFFAAEVVVARVLGWFPRRPDGPRARPGGAAIQS
jgi:vitamin K-dependent gamma-carboxylase-like protein